MSTISVLLAAYNGEKYLPGQLQSLVRQDYRDFCVLMHDDGSTDHTPDLLRDMAEKDSRFRVTGGGTHLGCIGSFWQLMKEDNSPYTALCDQDDEWSPCRLSACLDAMQKAEERYGSDTPLLVHSDCAVMAEDGTMLHPSFFNHQGWDREAVQLQRLLVQNNVTGCTVLMNRPLREIALRCGKPEDMVMHDWFLALTAASFGQIVFVDQPLVNYRQHGSNVKGASRENLTTRGVKALSKWEKGKQRIALTYRHGENFCRDCGSLLPDTAQKTINAYLATEHMGKIKRIARVFGGGYVMQSPVTRMGQMIFG